MNENETNPTPDTPSEDQTSVPAETSLTPVAQPAASTPEAQPEASAPDIQPMVPIREAQSVPPAIETQPVVLTADAQLYLSQTGPWVRLLSIMLFIGAGLLIMTGASLVLMGLAGMDSSMGSLGSSPLPNGVIVLIGPIYVVMALLIYILPGIFLFRYASAIKAMKSDPSSPALEDALRHQKTFWRYLGITAIVMLGIAVLAVMAIMFFAVMMSLRR
jgi:hypothetical protein